MIQTIATGAHDMHSMSKAPIIIGCIDRDERAIEHPCWNNHANNPFNGYSWSSDEGLVIDEAAQRMSMITEYATFDASPAFRRVWDAAANAALHTGRGWSEDGIDYYGYVNGMEAERDLRLACMGL
jgi:hypothetical protein